jgi:hypothetical protein
LRELNDLSLGSLRFERIQVDSQTIARQAPQSFIHGDAGKPGRKTGIAAKAIHIFGFGVVPQDAAGDPVKPPIVPLHDDTKCDIVTRKRAPHKFGIVGWDRNTVRRRWFHDYFPCCRIRCF